MQRRLAIQDTICFAAFESFRIRIEVIVSIMGIAPEWVTGVLRSSPRTPASLNLLLTARRNECSLASCDVESHNLRQL